MVQNLIVTEENMIYGGGCMCNCYSLFYQDISFMTEALSLASSGNLPIFKNGRDIDPQITKYAKVIKSIGVKSNENECQSACYQNNMIFDNCVSQ